MPRKRTVKIGDVVCITWEDITEIEGWSDETGEDSEHELLCFKSYGVLTKMPPNEKDLYEIIGDVPQNGGKQGRKQLFPAGAVKRIEKM